MDYNDAPTFLTKRGKRYRWALGCHDKKQAEDRAAGMRRMGHQVIVVPVSSYCIYTRDSSMAKEEKGLIKNLENMTGINRQKQEEYLTRTLGIRIPKKR